MHNQQSRGEVSRHTWHRQESDESSESVNEDMEAARTFPRSSTFPTTSHQAGAAQQSGSQRHYGRTSDPVSGSFRAQRTPRMPMGGWSEENQMSRHHDPVPEEGSEDELPPHIHKVT
ncbi:autophagy-related protein 9A-like [Cyprinus carpio]|nr:autophagy-related protein 9A-like [Cyprinus carpio]